MFNEIYGLFDIKYKIYYNNDRYSFYTLKGQRNLEQ